MLLDSLKKNSLLENSFGQLLLEEFVGNKKLQENRGLYSSEDTESNGASDWLEKASTQLVTHSLEQQARKLQSIDELFLDTKRKFKRLL